MINLANSVSFGHTHRGTQQRTQQHRGHPSPNGIGNVQRGKQRVEAPQDQQGSRSDQATANNTINTITTKPLSVLIFIGISTFQRTYLSQFAFNDPMLPALACSSAPAIHLPHMLFAVASSGPQGRATTELQGSALWILLGADPLAALGQRGLRCLALCHINMLPASQ